MVERFSFLRLSAAIVKVIVPDFENLAKSLDAKPACR